jgi:hypothetical protein
MKHCFLAKKKLLNPAPAKSTVEKWFAKLNEAKCASKTMQAVDARKRLLPTKTLKKVHKIFLNDRKVKLIDIAETLKISKERVGHIVHEHLDMQKLCAKWVPRVLTIDQKQQRFDDSEQCLATFNRNKDEFFRRCITIDETWLLHYTPESN